LRGSDTRLVTLTGPGGIGKTRLALAVAEQLRGAFSDGIWFISLAPIADHQLVIPTVAHALGIEERANQPTIERLIGHLRERQALLVLDNVEHVVAAGPQIAQLLTACPALAVLATGREPLRLHGEHQYLVPPLELPAMDGRQSDSALIASDAVRLFIERAAESSPGFLLTKLNEPVINEICRRLDGLPLALELAAARIKVLSPDDLLARLDQPLKVLAGGPRDAPARQQTMRDTLQWSYDLLTPDERQLFRRLSVFAGGCTLAAVEATASHDDVLATLSSLVDKSLVRRVDQPGQLARYDMLEPVRQFALERLNDNGDEAARTRRQHAGYFLSLAEGLNERADGPDGPLLFERIESEHDNLRAALRCLHDSAAVEDGLRLVGELCVLWIQRGYIDEGQAHAETFLNLPGAAQRTVARARALWSLSWLRLQRGEHESALPSIDESRAIAEACGDRSGLAQALFVRGLCCFRRGDADAAQSDWERALPLFRELGEEAMVVRVLVHLGKLAHRDGDLKRSCIIIEEALTLARAGDLKMVTALALGALGIVAEQEGDAERSAALYGERLALYHELGIPRGVAESISLIARLARRRRQLEQAACLFGAASVLREQSGSSWYDEMDYLDLEEELSALRSRLPDAAFQSAWGRGRAMPADDAIDLALRAFMSARDELASPPPAGMTPRELEVLRLLAAGKSNRQIAEAIFLSSRTVERHVANIYRKIDVHNRSEATAYALGNKLA
jgi:predicted ATPase/DNA-binding CsgD family transcriptional regulator